MNLPAALKRLDNNQQLLLEMIGFFAEDVPVLLDNLQRAIEAAAPDQVKRASHSIKGLAATFDAAEVIEIALRIEEQSATGDLSGLAPTVAELRVRIDRLLRNLAEYVASTSDRR
jgi:HPt (histidine-containing phosphotransfer) domain-containing protein